MRKKYGWGLAGFTLIFSLTMALCLTMAKYQVSRPQVSQIPLTKSNSFVHCKIDPRSFTMDKLSHDASYIVRGTILGRGDTVTYQKFSTPYQQVHVHVTEVIKGRFVGRTMDFLEPGGTNEEATYLIDDIRLPSYQEEVLLFLDEKGRYIDKNSILYITDGKVHIQSDRIQGLGLYVNTNTEYMDIPVEDFIAAIRFRTYGYLESPINFYLDPKKL